MRVITFAALVVFTAAVAGCDGEPAPAAPCDDVPVVTWDTFGQGFLRTQCQGCHASTAFDRQGAPASVTFDAEDDVRAHTDRILARAAPADGEPTMPPAGGVPPVDRERLKIWLRCFE